MDRTVDIQKDVTLLYNQYNDLAEVYPNGDVVIKGKKYKNKFKNENDAVIYLLRLGWLYE